MRKFTHTHTYRDTKCIGAHERGNKKKAAGLTPPDKAEPGSAHSAGDWSWTSDTRAAAIAADADADDEDNNDDEALSIGHDPRSNTTPR